ncbi:O-antigen ligase family protein [Acrocarpospora catenulata]|uniref:O-antigen ligase family protein n=1 Tax=Acrocarpospora catenulata TaxID=2836182 RepID=UPI001BD9C9A0|nr:O-antigen ligase family protein [Acrocarpospora catenulata]
MSLTLAGPTRAGAGWTAVFVAAAVLAVYSGIAFASGESRATVVIPVAVALSLALGVVALTRFYVFVLIVLGVRASLDATKLAGSISPSGGGETAASWLDPSSMLGALFLVAGLAWLVAQGRRTAGASQPLLPVAAGAFLVACLLSTLGSLYLNTSLGEVVRIGAVLIMIFVVARLVAEDPARLPGLLVAVFAAAVLPALVTIQQLLTGEGLVELNGSLRPHGTFWHPNALGMFCYVLIVAGVAIFPHVATRARIGIAAVLALTGVALLGSGARGAMIAALAGLVVVGLLQNRRLLLGLFALVVAVVIAVPGVVARFADLTETRTEGGLEANSLVWRFDHWGQALDLLGLNPITGTGLGTTRLLIYKEVHNDYLRALVESGLLGLVTYLGLLAALVVTAYRALRATRPDGGLERGCAVAFAGCTAALLVSAISDNAMTSVVVMWYFAVFAGIALWRGGSVTR